MSPSEQNPISQAIAQLRCCTQVNIQNTWQGYQAIADGTGENTLLTTHYSLLTPNAKGHIAWHKGRQVLWLMQKLIIPQQLQSYPLEGLCLRLALTWWAEEAQISVNDRLVQEGDLFDCSTRVLLSQSVKPGEEILVTLRLVSPGHDDGALVRSLCIYESNSDEYLEPGFVADEFAVLQCYLETFAPEKLPALAAAVTAIDWSILPDRQKFERSLLQARASLLPFSEELKQRQMQLLGHAHLDLAWLWAVSETWEAAQSTFISVLNLLQAFPELTFCHSTPALYAWIEQHRPDLFIAIQQQVKAGRWEIVGGLWVEPELNLISGESIVRQLLYGQHYVRAKFGTISTVAWLPDSFGFCATLPQFLALGGIEYFVTQKLRWNDTTEFPYSTFWWRSPDGTELFSLMSAPIGEGIDPVKMSSYAWNWETQTILKQALWLPGVGDHGGGPTRDMLEVARRWQHSPFFPNLEFTTAEQYLQQIRSQESGVVGAGLSDLPVGKQTTGVNPSVQNSEFKGESTTHYSLLTTHYPLWQNELYLEFHRGCYTTHAEQKRWNRRCEGLLYQAELFASLATISVGIAYPKAVLEAAWKKVLFNQFHDILPGSAITQVYVEADRDWQEVEQSACEILQQSLQAIATQIVPTPPHPEAQPIVVFNPLNWQRSEVVEVWLPVSGNPESKNWQICDLAGHEVESQLEVPSEKILFLADDIPACGYRVFWLCPCNSLVVSTPWVEDFILENEFLQVTVDPFTGNLSSVFDKIHQLEVLSGLGNQLQAFHDSGQYWDAWNIDPDYAKHPLPPAELLDIRCCEQGVLRTCIQVVRRIGQSEFRQDYILEKGSAVLRVKTSVDWQERHVMVKAAFPLNVTADYATYEIPCGVIQRPTQPQTPAERAKWEVPALQWADLSGDNYGVSLLNDCKHGYDSQPNQIRLTLLRGSVWPDPEADRGQHEFTYALYPHSGSWQSAHTVRRGYELNLSLQVMLLPSVPDSRPSQMPASSSLLDLSAKNLILMAFKQSENNPHQWILRCYEAHGEPAVLSLQSDLGLEIARSVDLLEQPLVPHSASHAPHISPWKITTFEVGLMTHTA